MEILLASLLGLLLGSFLNVVILRIPKDESIVFGGSHCMACGNKLKPWHNIPILSWIILRGKCSFCKTKISAQYPIIELLSAIIFFTLATKYGISVPILFVGLSFLMLLALSMIDFKYKMVTSSAHRAAKKTQTSWTKNYHTYPFIEAMGEGDIMVAATMGALLGVKLTLVAIFFSALLALPVMLALLKRSAEEQRVPFVPFLAIATFIVYIYDTPILNYIEANY